MEKGFEKHPVDEQLEKFLHGKLSSDEQQSVETHVENCETCCNVLRSMPHDRLVERLRSADSTVDFSALRKDQENDLDFELGNSDIKSQDIPSTLLNHPRYEIIKKLGVGGMGVVYLAKHRFMERTVALKVINSQLLQNDDAIKRFHKEVKAAAQLLHRNIVTAYDAEQAGDLHFLVMEYIEGDDLASIITQRGRISVLRACNYMMQAANGLQQAHEKGMVHRDIKPQNLMSTPKGVIKILDFGLARLAGPSDSESQQSGLTDDGVTLGTPDFIAPEQARDAKRADIRSDIYSLGCTLYYLLSKKLPFPDGTAIEKVISHCEFTPEKLFNLREDIPEPVINIVEKMMSKNPDDRFQTPKEVSDALRPFGLPGNSSSRNLNNTSAKRSGERREITGVVKKHNENGSNSSGRRMPGQGTIITSLVGLITISLLVFAYYPGDESLGKKTDVTDVTTEENPAKLPVDKASETETIQDNKVLSQTDKPLEKPILDNDSAWIDLIERVDPNDHAVEGDWNKNSNGLSVNAREWARLELPFEPSEEYDFEVEFTRNTGVHSIVVMFVKGNGQANFEIDAWEIHLAGIQQVDGQDLRTNSTKISGQHLENGRKYTALVKVRDAQVETYLDGKRLNIYKTDGSDLSLLENWSISSSRSLGLGAYDSATTFHRVRVRSVSP